MVYGNSKRGMRHMFMPLYLHTQWIFVLSTCQNLSDEKVMLGDRLSLCLTTPVSLTSTVTVCTVSVMQYVHLRVGI